MRTIDIPTELLAAMTLLTASIDARLANDTIVDCILNFAHVACNLQREADIAALDGVYSAEYMRRRSPLVVPSTED